MFSFNSQLVDSLKKTKTKRLLIIAVGTLILINGIVHSYKPLPHGTNFAGTTYPIHDSQITLLFDYTFTDESNERKFEHTIFETILETVNTTTNYLLLDMFLYNNQLGLATSSYRPLSTELSEKLVAQQHSSDIYVITDYINTAYGSYYPEPIKLLKNSNIPVLFTDTSVLRDSNPIYSSLYRSFLQFIPPVGGNFLPNPFDPNHEQATISAYLKGLNFKANHRKVLVASVTDSEDEDSELWTTIISSLNPHDGSSAHSNIGIKIDDHPIILDILETEQAVAQFTNNSSILPREVPHISALQPSQNTVTLLTENAIKQSILTDIKKTTASDQIHLAMFYFSDRDIIKALKQAANRGAQIQVLLDPNKDAFGREKNGIPNRQVGRELHRHSENITVRWCATNGEQCHSKLLLIESNDTIIAHLGSANFTRRNLNNLNLETNLRLSLTNDSEHANDILFFFNRQWSNKDGLFSLPFSEYEDTNILRVLWYRIGEFTGMSHY